MSGAPLLVALLLAGCRQGDDPAATALAPWPDDPEALARVCAEQPYEELAITCRVQAAANFARAGDTARAEATCAEVAAGTWRDECHFRVGEELGRAGRALPALRNCANAGFFGRFCLTHAGWNLPRDPEIGPTTAPAQIEAAALELLGAVDQALTGAADGLDGEGRDIFLSRFGYNVYVGSGSAEPAPAHLDGPVGAALRGGFAIEAARLLSGPTVEHIVAIWRGEAVAPSGAPLGEAQRVGRYVPPVLPPHEEGLPHLPVYGGGMRLVGEDPLEDVTIAALEALFWLPQAGGEQVLPWVSDPRPRVRWTAARLLCFMPSAEIDLEAELARLRDEGVDEGVRWHAAHGLERRTWERRRPFQQP